MHNRVPQTEMSHMVTVLLHRECNWKIIQDTNRNINNGATLCYVCMCAFACVCND